MIRPTRKMSAGPPSASGQPRKPKEVRPPGDAGAEPAFGRDEDQHDRRGDGRGHHGGSEARVAERGGEQPNADGETEREGVEQEGVACAADRPGSGLGVSHGRVLREGGRPKRRICIFAR